MIIELPFPLPTWNRLLAMNHWERKKCRDLIHRMTCISIQSGVGLPTSTEYQRKQPSMELCRLEYLAMIRPSGSKALPTPRKNAGRAKMRGRS